MRATVRDLSPRNMPRMMRLSCHHVPSERLISIVWRGHPAAAGSEFLLSSPRGAGTPAGTYCGHVCRHRASARYHGGVPIDRLQTWRRRRRCHRDLSGPALTLIHELNYCRACAFKFDCLYLKPNHTSTICDTRHIVDYKVAVFWYFYGYIWLLLNVVKVNCT